jgi:hypothetical protein
MFFIVASTFHHCIEIDLYHTPPGLPTISEWMVSGMGILDKWKKKRNAKDHEPDESGRQPVRDGNLGPPDSWKRLRDDPDEENSESWDDIPTVTEPQPIPPIPEAKPVISPVPEPQSSGSPSGQFPSRDPPPPFTGIPPLEPIDLDLIVPAPESLLPQLIALFEACNEKLRELEQSGRSINHFPWKGSGPIPMRYTTPEDVRIVFNALKDLKAVGGRSPITYTYDSWSFNKLLTANMKPILENPEVRLVHVLRLLLMLHSIHDDYQVLFPNVIEHYRKHASRPFDLRELAHTMDAIGSDSSLIVKRIFSWGWSKRWASRHFFKWEDDAVWPFFAEHPKPIRNILTRGLDFRGHEDYDKVASKTCALIALGTFPSPPKGFIPLLWELALGTAKTYHPFAQHCLNHLPDIENQLLSKLKRSSKKVTTILAAWIAEIGSEKSIEPLKEKLAAEKDPVAKVVLIESLEKLGVPGDELIDREGLAREATEQLKRGPPKELSWFPFVDLPMIHWADTGQLLHPLTLHWLIVQSFKMKSAEPTGLLIRYTALFNEAEKIALGRFVLDSFLAYDLTPAYTPDEARSWAHDRMPWAEQYSRNHGEPFDRKAVFQTFLKKRLAEVGSGATKEIGILALCSTCCGPDIVPVIKGYIEKWYGNRWRQCVALVDVLAWSGHPTGIQYLLMIADTFRTKSIREEAAKQVKLLAEREGWTVDQLGDRTIPTGGFDEDRTLIIDYGERQFTAKLDTSFAITLTDSSGIPIDSLPDPLPDEDTKHVKDEIKALNTAKKVVRAAVRDQTVRLYEALCTQRSWPFEEWERCFLKHPIAGFLSQRLVWTAGEGTSFIPMEDRSFVDSGGSSVTLSTPDTTTIRLAHTSTIGAEQGASWKTFLTSRGIKPLFEQFGEGMYIIPDDLKEETENTDFLGFVLPATTLRKEARKLGYVKGPVGDKWFYDFRKKLPGIGIEVIIGFSGYASWFEETDVALKKLSFLRIAEDEGGPESGTGGMEEAIPLGEVPPVLLAEAYGHMKRIAEQGTGYDPEWPKHTGYNRPRE